MRIEIEVPDVVEFKGKKYRPTGEFRQVVASDVAIAVEGSPFQWTDHYKSNGHYVILEQIEEWQPAKVPEVGKGLEQWGMTAQFRDNDRIGWCDGILEGYNSSLKRWRDEYGNLWNQCEVLVSDVEE